MQYNDTSGKSGLLQDCEFLTNLGDGVISGDTTLKAAFTRLINLRYARTLAKIQLLSGRSGAEDTNYTSQQFSFFAIQSGVSSYQFLTDQSGNTITDITGVLIQPSNSTDYKPLHRLTLSDHDALLVMSPNASRTGTPTGYIEKNNTVYLDRLPDYTAASGGKLFYRLVPSYFTTSDTTKAAGYVEAYHRILSLGASWEWLLVNKPDNTALITRAESELAAMTIELVDYIQQQNPTAIGMTAARHSSR